MRRLGEIMWIMSLYNAHWPFVLTLQQTAPVNELLNPDVQLEEAILKWNQDFLSVFLSLFAWLTLESPDRGCINSSTQGSVLIALPRAKCLKRKEILKTLSSSARSLCLEDFLMCIRYECKVKSTRNVTERGVCVNYRGGWPAEAAGARSADGMASP